jgi:hypothetical protein
MTNSWAYPTLRTPDVGQALDVVSHLLGVADRRDTFLVSGREPGGPQGCRAISTRSVNGSTPTALANCASATSPRSRGSNRAIRLTHWST